MRQKHVKKSVYTMKIQTLKNVVINTLKNRDDVEMISNDWADFFGDSYAVMFKVNGHNVYRIILNMNGSLYFQCVRYAVNVSGNEYYDESVDYKCVRNTREYIKVLNTWSAMIDEGDLVDNDYNNWAGYVSTWIDECEHDDPNYTIYE